MHALIIAEKQANTNWINNPFVATGLSVNIIKAHTMDEAVRLIMSVQFDLVMYDINFSEDLLSQNLKQISDICCDAPLVVLTNQLGDPLTKVALNSGANYHIVKDQFDLSLMAKSLKTMLLKNTFNYN